MRTKARAAALVTLWLAVSLLPANPAAAGATVVQDLPGDAWGAGLVPAEPVSSPALDALRADVSYDPATQTLRTVMHVRDLTADPGTGIVIGDVGGDVHDVRWSVRFVHAGEEYSFFFERWYNFGVHDVACFGFVYLSTLLYSESGFECDAGGIDEAAGTVTIQMTLARMNAAKESWGAESPAIEPGDTIENIEIVTYRDGWPVDRTAPTDVVRRFTLS